MQGYQPPLSKLPGQGIPFDLERCRSLPPSFGLDMGEIPIGDSAGEIVAPIIALVDVIRYHGFKSRCDQLVTLDPTAVRDWLHDRLRINQPLWPLSFQVMVEALRNHGEEPYRTTVRRVDPEAGGIEAVPDPGGIDLGGLEARCVPTAIVVLKWALASGYPLACGFAATESMDDAATYAQGLIRLPRPGERLIDGAAVVVCGWDDSRDSFRVRGTDGDRWGDRGYGWIPYAYLTQPLWIHEVVCITAI